MMNLLLTELVSVSHILECKGWLAHAYGTESCMGSIKYGTKYIDAQNPMFSEQAHSSFSLPSAILRFCLPRALSRQEPNRKTQYMMQTVMAPLQQTANEANISLQ
jgi:hypothetical protein